MSAAIVSNNADLSISRPPGTFARLKRGLALSGWLGMLLGGGLGYIATRPHIYFPLHLEESVLLLFQLTGMLAAGLMLALSLRVVMRGVHNILRFGASLPGIALAVASYELIDSRFFEIFSEFSHPDPADPGIWTAMLFMGSLGAIFGLTLGSSRRRPVRTMPVPQVIDVEPLGERPALQPASEPPAPRPKRKPRERTRTEAQQPVQRAVRRARRARAADPAPAPEVRRIEVQPRAEPQIAIKPTRAKRRRGIKVKMGRSVTNVCPYCLEEVEKNDRRGRVVCRICGTPHHGDCWAITGKCEVPHLQTRE